MKFDGLWVETNVMKEALNKQGFTNVTVIPNFKELKILTEGELVYPEDKPYKLCTFSRVMKEKGIEDAINAVKNVNESFGYTALSLDIYGQIDINQTEWFENLKQKFPDYINYGGEVPFEKSTEVLKEYFALLFPTRYEGEGFAGTLIDAMAAGVPVVASDWKYNSEIVTSDIGFIYPTGNQKVFESILVQLVENPESVINMKICCITKANSYSIETVIGYLKNELSAD